jgi:hypothetical protein
MKTLLFLIATVTFLATDALATAQIGDLLEFEGKRETIFATPLEDYFTDERQRPELPASSSACWRGYIGLWSLKDDQLSLVALHQEDWEKPDTLGKEIPLKLIFGTSSSPVKADWFTGVLRLPRGERLRYVHMGFGSIYEKDLYLTIKKGKLVARREVNNTDIGATRSTSDLQWVAMSKIPVPDAGNWTDARLIFDDQADRVLTTRGIFFESGETEPPSLWIPHTPTTSQMTIELSLPKNADLPSGTHVEISGHFDAKNRNLAASSIRKLKAGESIHHAKFTAPKPETK